MCCLYVPLKLKIGLAWLEFTLLLNPKIQNQRCLLTKNYLSVGNSSRDGNTRDHLTCLLGHLYAGQEATVRTGHGTVDWFQIGQGICQGYMLSPCLFYLYAEYIIRNAGLDEAQTGIEIARRNINNLRYADSVKFSSVAQSCPTLCDPMNRSTPGLPVHHQLPEFTQTHVHRVGDAIQPSHPLSSSSPPAPNPSQHQGFFQ